MIHICSVNIIVSNILPKPCNGMNQSQLIAWTLSTERQWPSSLDSNHYNYNTWRTCWLHSKLSWINPSIPGLL